MAIKEKIRRGKKEGVSRGRLFPLLVLISLLSLAAFALVGAFILSMTENPAMLIGAFSIGVTVVSSGVVSALISHKCAVGGISLAVLVALGTELLMLAVSLIMTGGAPLGGAVINYGCYIAVAALAAFVAMPRQKQHRHRR